MKKIFYHIVSIFVLCGLLPAQGLPENGAIKSQWFLAYQGGEKANENYNSFRLRRGYLTFERDFAENFSGRLTYDISVDREGDGEGDIELRLKYLYLKYKMNGGSSYFEFGLVHRPWLDFEEHINHYRMQGTMFIERYGVINSADYGLTFVSLLGGKVDSTYQKNVNSKYPGRYGSMAVGIYNGGGYHGIEKNNNKTIEGRFTLRPFPDSFTGLQLSYTGAYGKGNQKSAPDWIMNTGFISYEHVGCIFTATYYRGKGDFRGTAADTTGAVFDQNGFSVFGEVFIPDTKFSVIGRFDRFTRRFQGRAQNDETFIIGIANRIFPGGKVLLDYEKVSGTRNDYFFEVAIELKY